MASNCGLFVHGNDHAFACGQTIGLHHNRRAVFTHMGLGGLCISEMAIACGRCLGRVADLFGKAFGGFQFCSLSRGAKDQNARFAQTVRDPCGQRGLGADDHKVNGVFLGKAHHRAAVFRIQGCTFRDLGDARIARRHKQLVTFWVLLDRPCQRCVRARRCRG